MRRPYDGASRPMIPGAAAKHRRPADAWFKTSLVVVDEQKLRARWDREGTGARSARPGPSRACSPASGRGHGSSRPARPRSRGQSETLMPATDCEVAGYFDEHRQQGQRAAAQHQGGLSDSRLAGAIGPFGEDAGRIRNPRPGRGSRRGRVVGSRSSTWARATIGRLRKARTGKTIPRRDDRWPTKSSSPGQPGRRTSSTRFDPPQRAGVSP